ncbi:MAG TPA: YCF48-related protein [Limnobacter sp.]|uniref:WD40/YVTN/BNR-like repeat-containing protein n=1 Tax=Limnobacter sp. TaxID=2003368 RepID=UPI002ED98236
MKKPLKPALIRRACGVGAVLLALGLTVQPAQAFKDPMDIPAIVAPKAAKALMLNVTSRGNVAVVVGERGIVLRRDFSAPEPKDGAKDQDGHVWTQAKVPVSINMTAIEFASDSVAYMAGHDGVVLKSTDAGASWTRVFDGNKANAQVVAAAKAKYDAVQARYDALPAAQQSKMDAELEAAQFALEDAEAGARFGPARPMLGLWFRNENQGWVVGSYGQIFETTDGGANWKLIADRLNNPDFRHYNGIYGDDTGLLLIAGEAGRIYRSNNFGQTWERLDTGYNGHFYGTAVLRSSTGEPTIYAYGFSGNVYRMGPGAAGWWKMQSPTKESFVQAIAQGNSVLLVDQKGRLVKTDPTGTQLTMVMNKEGKPVTGMALVGKTLVLSGQGGPRTVDLPQ